MSQRLEASGFPCLLLISINLSDIAILNINSSDYRCIISLIHWFTISVPVLTLPVFRQLLLRNGNISRLFWNEWTQRAESRWLQQSYFTSISKLVLNVFKIVLYFKSIINSNQIKNYWAIIEGIFYRYSMAFADMLCRFTISYDGLLLKEYVPITQRSLYLKRDSLEHHGNR